MRILFTLLIITKLKNMVRKAQIFCLTFLAYTSIHAIRTSYSESKSFIQKDLEIQSNLMGVLDSLMLLFLGIGHFIHAIKPMKKPIKCLWIAMLVCATNFIIMPILIDVSPFHSYFYLLIFVAVNGYVQSYTWPTLLMLINSKFSSKSNSILLGFWATNANFGNIIGYFVFQMIKFEWKLNLIIVGIYTFINGLLLCLRIDQLPQNKSNSHQRQDRSIDNTCLSQQSTNRLSERLTSSEVTTQTQNLQEQPLSAIKVFRDPKIVLITISFALIKSIIYGIMLWLPLYFQTDDGLKEYASLIPITYDVWAIFGSIFIGYLFIKIINKGLLMIPFMLALVCAFSFLRFFYLGVAIIFFIIGVVGFCLGGIFNTLAGLVVIELTSFLPQYSKSSSLGFYSALTMAIANITTALTQVLIGFVIGKQHQQGIFLVFLIYSVVCLICLITISIISRSSRTMKRKEISCKGTSQADIKEQSIAEVPFDTAVSSQAHLEFKNRLLIQSQTFAAQRKLSTSSQNQDMYTKQCLKEGHRWCSSAYERNIYHEAK